MKRMRIDHIALGIFVGVLALFVLCADLCCTDRSVPQSASGVKQTSVHVSTDTQGLTTEQENIRERLVEDNRPGAVKHLYVVSAYSGQVIVYSTVRGKVTSGGKRLTPTSVAGAGEWGDTIEVKIAGEKHKTTEVLQDDGTYGHSMDYLYWWDTRGVYHQHYVAGGQIVHVSSQPLSVKGVIINMELAHSDE